MNFTIEEYKERLENTKKRMEEEEIEVLLVMDTANMNYLTGYDAWSFYVPQLLIVDIDEDQPYWIGREIDANAARYTTWLDHNYIQSYSEQYILSPNRHPMDFVADFIKRRKLDQKNIGMEFDADYFTAKSYFQLVKDSPEAKVKDATNLVNWVRSIKSEQEITYMKQAATTSEKAMNIAFDLINEGVPEYEIAAAVAHAQVMGTEEFGGDYPAIPLIMPTGEQTSANHLNWSDNPIKSGELIDIELSGAVRRYHSPLTRVAVVGEPSEEVSRLSEVMNEGINESLEVIKPGVACEDVNQVMTEVFHRHGYENNFRSGYTVGLGYPPNWGEGTASFGPEDRTILQPNMTFHMIPTIELGHVGMEISDTLRVTESGYELLTNHPRELFVKEN